MKITLQSVIVSPLCWYKQEETMPTDACQYFYEYENLKLTQVYYCVYCSYGNIACPPIQQDKNGC